MNTLEMVASDGLTIANRNMIKIKRVPDLLVFTTLSPIIVRREFGAASFGAVYGIASCLIQLATGLGPSFYGLLHDAFAGYRVPLLLAAAVDLVAAAVVVTAGRPQTAMERL